VERIGHRGAPREFPENSLPSFERALVRGANAVELDVHVSADGVPVVHHDPDISVRMDDRRVRRPLTSMTWKEIARVEVAADVFVPSLEQVLDLVSTRGTVYVELKGRGVADRAIDVINSSRTRCAVHSFDHSSIERASKLAPSLRRGILFEKYPPDVVRAMREASALDVWPHWELVDAALMTKVHAAGGRVIAWTVNTATAAEHLVRLGVDALCGDDVRLLPA